MTGKLESKIIPVDKIVESMKSKHEQKLREVSAEKQKHENFEYNIVNTLNEDGGGVNALKVVKEKMLHGNRSDAEKKKSGILRRITFRGVFDKVYLFYL